MVQLQAEGHASLSLWGCMPAPQPLLLEWDSQNVMSNQYVSNTA